MNNKQHDSKQYTASDIQNYLDGKLLPGEMNLLEKAALEDPFLADAIEGLALEKRDENLRHLTDLRERLEKKAAPARVIPFYKSPLTKAVAAFLLLTAGVWLVYTLLFDAEPSQLALHNAHDITVLKQDSMPHPPPPTVAETYKKETPAVPQNKSTLPAIARQMAQRDNTRTIDEHKDTAPLPGAAPASVNAVPAPSARAMYEKRDVAAGGELKDKAEILSSKKEEESLSMSTLDSLAMNNKLDEVVVVGYGKKKQGLLKRVLKPAGDSTGDSAAVPLKGMSEYEEYLKKNKRIPPEERNIHGEVTLSFNVRHSGKITNIKVVKSLSPSLDKEAIRLIKDGPQWKRVRNTGKTFVSVPF